MNNLFEIGYAAKLSGLTVSMVDYLCRTKIVIPSTNERGRGRKRLYTFAEVVVLKAVSKLLKAGVDVCKLGKALKALRKYHPEITPDTLPNMYLVTDGEEVYFRQKDNVLECLATGQMSFAFVIEIESIRKEILSHEEYIVNVG